MGDGKMGVGRGGAGVVDVGLTLAMLERRSGIWNSDSRAAADIRRGHNGGDQRWGTDEMSGGGGIWQWGQRWGSAVGDG